MFYSLRSEPEAIILTNHPVPTKKWSFPTFVDKSILEGEEWKVTTQFRQFLCDDKHVHFLEFDYCRIKPGYISGNAEFFVSDDYVKEKLRSLHRITGVTEYTWDPTVPTWVETQCN
ncbi:hypothetical protein QFZ28_006018 [Neobacillus niacini]|uniref:hypothetical protein n=1 Tax=Neobacillus niacini TaxID=86668 RepID=UPI002781DBDE|nr:hypothetical protein [Neobacillus niacini]MDQ1005440.1 hypothetical protein [Neobacillus niacini]